MYVHVVGLPQYKSLKLFLFGHIYTYVYTCMHWIEEILEYNNTYVHIIIHTNVHMVLGIICSLVTKDWLLVRSYVCTYTHGRM